MRLRVLALSVALGASVLLGTPARAVTQLEAAWNAIDENRSGQGAPLRVEVTDQSVILRRPQEQPIEKAVFDQLIKERADPSFPTLRLTEDDDVLVWRVNSKLELEEHTRRPDTGAVARSWSQRKFTPVSEFPLADWPKFLKGATDHGLLTIRAVAEKNFQLLDLSFTQTGPSRVSEASTPVELTPEFYRWMRLSREYAPTKGKNGFVLLVHDPHASVIGRFQLLRGLRALATANKMPGGCQFLVEGDFTGERRFGMNGLDAALAPAKTAAEREAVVLDLLKRHVIDTPLAYRLLYGTGKISSYAIDDPTHLTTPSGAAPASVTKELSAVANVAEALRGAKTGNAATDKQLETALTLRQFEVFAYANADLTDAAGQRLVDYYQSREKALTALAALAEAILPPAQRKTASADIDLLKAQATAYDRERKIFADALARNDTMAREILGQVRAGADALQIAFIGNFHTPAVTEKLRTAGVGYAVIEPRLWQWRSGSEQEQFERILRPDSRRKYLGSLLAANKGYVAPSVDEVHNFLQPFIEQRSTGVRRMGARAVQTLGGTAGARVDASALVESLQTNGAFTQAEVGLGGANAAPPPNSPFEGAFAYFEPGDGSNRPQRFIITDPQDAEWSQKARYACLRDIVILPVEERDDASAIRSVSFFQDPGTSQLFVCAFDAASRRYYLLEGEKALGAVMSLELSQPGPMGEILIRLRLVEQFRALLAGERPA